MSGFFLQFNVYGANWFDDEKEKSGSGHMNVTFINPETGEEMTFGANVAIDADLSGMIFGGVGDKRDGVIQREDSKLKSKTNTRVSRQVPVTRDQFYKILSRVQSIEGATYNYAVLPGVDGGVQACASFANAIYRMTGHKYQVGALFSSLDKKKTRGPVWNAIPSVIPPEFTGGLSPELSGENSLPFPLGGLGIRPRSDAPFYQPKAPIADHVPDTWNVGVKLIAETKRYDGQGDENLDPMVPSAPGSEVVPRHGQGPSPADNDMARRERIVRAARREFISPLPDPTVFPGREVPEYLSENPIPENGTILTPRPPLPKEHSILGMPRRQNNLLTNRMS